MTRWDRYQCEAKSSWTALWPVKCHQFTVLPNLPSNSTNNHSLRSNSDWPMTIPSLNQIIQLTPFIIFKFSDEVFSIPTANYIRCIKTFCCRIFGYLTGINFYVGVRGTGRVVAEQPPCYLDLLWTKRIIRALRPFESIHVQKFGLEWTISIAGITSNSKCFTIIISKAICIIMSVLCRLNWIVVFAIETE